MVAGRAVQRRGLHAGPAAGRLLPCPRPAARSTVTEAAHPALERAYRVDRITREPRAHARPAIELARRRDDRAVLADQPLLELPQPRLARLAAEVVPAHAELGEPVDDPPVERVAGLQRQRRVLGGA